MPLVLLRAALAALVAVAVLGTTTPAATAAARPATGSAAAKGAAPRTAAPLAGVRFSVEPGGAGEAARQARARGDVATAAALDVVAAAPQAVWVGDWTAQPAAEVARVVAAARRAGTVPVLVLYGIPHRDCGLHSAGGHGPGAYRAFVRAVARGLGARKAVVVVEPDAVALLDCLPPAAQAERLALLRDAVAVLRGTGAVTYLDGGHAQWVPVPVLAGRLRAAGVARARGVAVNVSGFQTLAASTAHATALAAALPGLRAVVDTSRSGGGPTADAQWCNPPGRSLGPTARPVTSPVLDALLWVKRPGESDGGCGRGEPSAGAFWPAYAVGLVERAR